MKRRAKGEGTIYKRKDGRWCARLFVNGNPLYKYSRSKSECADWLLEMRQKHATVRNYAAGWIPLADYLIRWLSDIDSQMAYKTIILYRQQVRDYVIPHLGQTRLDQLRPEQIQSMYSTIYADKSANTVRSIHGTLHKALADAVRSGLLPRNPAEIARPPRVPQAEVQTLTREQVDRLLAAAQGDAQEHLYYLAVVTGMRQGELLGLQWQDLDRDNHLIHVRRQFQYRPGGVIEFIPPKSARGRRAILVSDETLERLEQQWQQVELLKVRAGKWTDYDLVFCTRYGTPIRRQNVNKWFSELLGRADLPPVRFHDLRHTNATLLLARNVNPKIVQERLGHASIQMTLDTYSHVIPPMQADAAHIFDT